MKTEYKSSTENYNELLALAREMTAQELKSVLRLRPAFHLWAVAAYEKALEEKTVSAVLPT